MSEPYIDEYLPALKEAAVDAYMRDQGFNRTGGEYKKLIPLTDPIEHEYVTAVTGDNATGISYRTDGMGGMLVDSESRAAEYQSAFQSVMESIDTIVDPWRDLPDLDEIQSLIDECGLASSALASEATFTTSGSVTANAALSSAFSGIDRAMDKMSGSTIEAFKSKFLGRLPAVVDNLAYASFLMGAHASAEKAIWEEAPGDVSEILETATTAFENVAGNNVGTLTVAFDVFGLAATGISLFAPGIVGKFGGAAGEVITFVEELSEDDSQDRTGGTYEEAVAALDGALSDLSAAIEREEESMKTNTESNSSNMSAAGQRENFDLSLNVVGSGSDASPIGDEDVDESSEASVSDLAVDSDLVKAVVTTYMPELSACLSTAGTRLVNITFSKHIGRSAGIGLSPFSLSYAIYDYSMTLYSLVKDLQWEVDLGAEQLDGALFDFQNTDDGGAGSLSVLSDRVLEGSPYTPWD